jgi:hypothetical protein
MVVFKTDRPNTRSFVGKRMLVVLFMLALPLVYDLIFPNVIGNTYYAFAAAYILVRLIDAVGTDRLYQVSIDAAQQQITLFYKSLFSGAKRMILPFEKANLEINKVNPKWSWLGEPVTLYFLQGKKEVFKITKGKDGFSVDSLNLIYKTIEEIPLPVKNV